MGERPGSGSGRACSSLRMADGCLLLDAPKHSFPGVGLGVNPAGVVGSSWVISGEDGLALRRLGVGAEQGWVHTPGET